MSQNEDPVAKYLIRKHARANDVPENEIMGIAKQETGYKGYDPTLTSPAGARGSLQVMPGTGKRHVSPDEFETIEGQIKAGVLEYKRVRGKYGAKLAPRAYHGGDGAVNNPNAYDPYAKISTNEYQRLVNEYAGIGADDEEDDPVARYLQKKQGAVASSTPPANDAAKLFAELTNANAKQEPLGAAKLGGKAVSGDASKLTVATPARSLDIDLSDFVKSGNPPTPEELSQHIYKRMGFSDEEAAEYAKQTNRDVASAFYQANDPAAAAVSVWERAGKNDRGLASITGLTPEAFAEKQQWLDDYRDSKIRALPAEERERMAREIAKDRPLTERERKKFGFERGFGGQAFADVTTGGFRAVGSMLKGLEVLQENIPGANLLTKGMEAVGLGDYAPSNVAGAAGDKLRQIAKEGRNLKGGQDTIDDFLSVTGGAVPYVAGGFAGAPVAATMGALANAGDLYSEARAAGASENTAGLAGLAGAPIGALAGLIGLGRTGSRVAAGEARGIVSIILREMGEEGTEEAVQQVLNNLVAKGIYDPKREVFKDVGYNATLGAFTGGALGGGTHIASRGIQKLAGIGNASKAQQEQIINEQTTPEPIPPSREVQGAPIEALARSAPFPPSVETQSVDAAQNQYSKEAVKPQAPEYQPLRDSFAERMRQRKADEAAKQSEDRGVEIVSEGEQTGKAEILKEEVKKARSGRRSAEREAEMDALTNVGNRRALDKALPSAEADPNTSVISFDANNFGQVNKIKGEVAGDEMLKGMVSAIETAAKEVSPNARVFRRGGDEIVVLAPKDAAEQIRAKAEEIFGERIIEGDGKKVSVSLSGSVGNTFETANQPLQAAKAARKAKSEAAPVTVPEAKAQQSVTESTSAKMFNEANDVRSNDKQVAYKQKNKPIRFGVENAMARRNNPHVAPLFKTANDGDYQAIPIGITRYEVTPRFGTLYQESSHAPGAMGDVFNVPHPGSDRFQPSDYKLVEPAIFERQGDDWKLVKAGRLELRGLKNEPAKQQSVTEAAKAPVIVPNAKPRNQSIKETDSLAAAVIKMGGLKLDGERGRDIQQRFDKRGRVGLLRKDGKPIEDIISNLESSGYPVFTKDAKGNGVGVDALNELVERLEGEASGKKVYQTEYQQKLDDAALDEDWNTWGAAKDLDAIGKQEYAKAQEARSHAELNEIASRGRLTDESVKRIEEIGIYELGWDKEFTDTVIKNLKSTIDESLAANPERASNQPPAIQESPARERQSDVEGRLSTEQVDRVKELHKSLKEQGISVDEHLRRGSLFNDLSPEQQDLLREMDKKAAKAPVKEKAQSLFDVAPTEESRIEAKQKEAGVEKRVDGDLFKAKESAPVEDAKAKEPFEMTREEWHNEFTSKDPQFYGSDTGTDTKSGGAAGRTISRIEHKNQLKMNLPDKWDADLGQMVPARHKEVIQHALEQGKTIPPEVLADYPDLVKASSAVNEQAASEAGEKSPDLTARLKAKADIASKKFNPNKLASNGIFDPELMAALKDIAAYHIVKSAGDFKNFSKSILEDLKEFADDIEPHLRKIWDEYHTKRGLPLPGEKIEQSTPVKAAVETAKANGEEIGHHIELQNRNDDGTLAPGVKGEGETTGVKNAAVEAERAERGLSPVMKEARKAASTTFDAGKEIVDADPNFRDKVATWAKTPKNLTDDETGAALYDRAKLHEEHQITMGQVLAAREAGDTIAEATAREALNRIEKQRDDNDKAVTHSGTQNARALAFRRFLVKEDYSLANLVQRAKVAHHGREISDKTRARLEKQAAELADLQEKFDKRGDRIAELEADIALKRIQEEVKRQNRQVKRAVTKQQLDAEYADLSKQFFAAASKLSANPLADPTLYSLIGKIAKNRVEAGFNTASGLVDEVYNTIKDQVKGVTKRDVRDAISGYGMPTKTKSQIDTEITKIKRELRKLSKDEDKDPATEAAKAEATKQKTQKTRLTNRLSELDALLTSKAYYKNPDGTPRLTKPRNPIALDADALRLQRDINIKKASIEQDFRKMKRESIFDTVTHTRQSAMLANVVGITQDIVNTTAHNITATLNMVPDTVLDIAQSWRTGQRTSALRGTKPFRSVGAGLKKAASESKLVFKTGVSERMAQEQEIPHESYTGEGKTAQIFDASRNYVSRIRTIADLPNWEVSLEIERRRHSRAMAETEHLDGKIQKGDVEARANDIYNDISLSDQADIVLDAATAVAKQEATDDARFRTFKHDNPFSRMIQQAANHPKTPPAARFTLRLIIPFEKAMSNYVKASFDMTGAGIATGLTRALLNIARGNRQALFGENRNVIAEPAVLRQRQMAANRAFGRGITGGAGGLLLGYTLAGLGVIGNPKDDENKKKGRVASLHIGDQSFDLSWLGPLALPLAMGAGYYHDQFGGATRAFGKGIQQAPAFRGSRELNNTGRLLESKDLMQGAGTLGGKVTSSFIPGVVKDAAKLSDFGKDRDAKGFTPQIQQNIPFWRRELPERKSEGSSVFKF